MPRWPLLLPPPAVLTSTSPLRSCGSLTSIVVESPSRCPLPFHHPQFAIVSSITAHHHCALGPLPRSFAPTLADKEPSRPSPTRSHHAIPHHQGAVAPSIAIAVEEPSRGLSPSRSRCAVSCHQGAVAPSIFRQGAIAPSLAVEEPLRHPLPSRSRCTVPCHQGAIGRDY